MHREASLLASPSLSVFSTSSKPFALSSGSRSFGLTLGLLGVSR
ncbi:hypothetical protein [Thermococcus prieurii]